MTKRWVLHMDMDAFFAAVEQRDNPDIAGKPVIIGGTGPRGVVSTASYEARKFGARSAMPTVTARRLCPHGIFLPPNHAKYSMVSSEIRRILEHYSPSIEPLSLDEAFLDISGTEWLYPDVVHIAKAVKEEIYQETKLTASVGVAPNKFLAKMASEHQKPDGLVVVRHGEEADFLSPIPIKKLWGVGEVTAKTLTRVGIHTIGQLRRADLKILEPLLGKAAYDLTNLAAGVDDRPVTPQREPKSIGNETTFEIDLVHKDDIRACLLALSSQVGARLRRKGYACRTVTLKVRFSSFQTLTRSVTLPAPATLDETIYQTVLTAFGKLKITEGIRLLGVSVSNLLTGFQMALFDEENEKRGRLSQVMDTLNEKYGSGTVVRANIIRLKENRP